MKLQFKAWGLVLATFGFLTVVAIGVSSSVISHRFSHLESEQAQIEGERARRLLEQQHLSLSATLKDYAYWIDSTAFLAGTRPDYLEVNFTAETMNTLRISEAVFMNLEGGPVHRAAIDTYVSFGTEGGATGQVLSELAKTVLADASGDSVASTYAQVDGKLYLLSVAAVRIDGLSGTAAHGALGMVREFDQSELVNFSRVLMVQVSLNLTGLPQDAEAVFIEVENDSKRFVRTTLLDHHNKPVAELVLQLDRTLHEAGKSLTQVTGVAVGLAGLLMGFLLIFLLDRLLLSRLQVIHRDVQTITDQGLIGEQLVHVEGNDELTDFGESVNRLLGRVRGDAAEQQTAFERHEALHHQLMQSQKTEALGRLSSGIAHDISNSLAAIGGWIHMAAEDLEPKHPSHASLQQALKGTSYADRMMRQLLAFSRKSPAKLESIEVDFLIQESRALVASGLMRTCELDIRSAGPSMWVRADLTQMQQVLVNLLINAADAMDGVGTITLTVSSYEACDSAAELPPEGAVGLLPGTYVRLSITDEGQGIDPAHIDRVFEPFFTTKSPGRGTGLGLSVAHSIMLNHSGGLGVRSQLGEGSTFTVFLVACEAPKA